MVGRPGLPRDIHVWFRCTDSLDEAAIAAAVSVLSGDERAQYGRFHFRRDARDYAAAHALLRQSLSRYGGRAPEEWRFQKDVNGKPFLVDEDAFQASFSLSHTHGMVACAVTAAADVGVDVECIDRNVDAADIAARFFAPSETAHLAQLDEEARQQRFFDLWTLKEALAKALGMGMALSLNRLAFAIAGDGGISLGAAPGIDAADRQFGLFTPGPRHRLAVAARSSASGPAQIFVRAVADEGSGVS